MLDESCGTGRNMTDRDSTPRTYMLIAWTADRTKAVYDCCVDGYPTTVFRTAVPFWGKPVKFWAVCRQNGAAVLKKSPKGMACCGSKRVPKAWHALSKCTHFLWVHIMLGINVGHPLKWHAACFETLPTKGCWRWTNSSRWRKRLHCCWCWSKFLVVTTDTHHPVIFGMLLCTTAVTICCKTWCCILSRRGCWYREQSYHGENGAYPI